MGDLPILTLHEVKTKILCQFPNKIKPRFKLAKERDLPQREGTDFKASTSTFPLLAFFIANHGRQGNDFDKCVDTLEYVVGLMG